MTSDFWSTLLGKLILVMALIIGLALIVPVSTCHLSRNFCEYAIAGPTKYDYDSIAMIGAASENGTIVVKRKKFLLSEPSIQFFEEGAQRPYFAREYLASFAPIFNFSEDRRRIAAFFLTEDWQVNSNSRLLEFHLIYTNLNTESFDLASILCHLEGYYSDVIEVGNLLFIEEKSIISVEFTIPCGDLTINGQKIGFVSEKSGGTLIVLLDELGNFSEFTSAEFLEYQNQDRAAPREGFMIAREQASRYDQGDAGWLDVYYHYTKTITDTGVAKRDVEQFLIGRNSDGEIVVKRLSFSRNDQVISAGMSEAFAAFYENIAGYSERHYRSDQIDEAPLTAERYDVHLFEDDKLSFEVRLPTLRSRIQVVGADQNRVQFELFADADELMINGIRFDLPETPPLRSEDGSFKGRFEVTFSETGRPLSFDRLSQ